jgi:hypothetical protein
MTALMRVKVPRLDLPDIAITWGGVDVSVRQLGFLIGGALVALNVWFALDILGQSSVLLLGVRGLLAAIPLGIALAFGWIKIQGRPLEHRLLAIWTYRKRPQIYVWRSLRDVPIEVEKPLKK